MDSLTRLNMATVRAQQEDDLPDYLAVRIFAIADQLQNGIPLQEEVEELIEQLELYDTYGQTGYIGMGVNNLILEGTICRFEEKLKESPNSSRE
jgi:hypothetical protein